VAVLQHLCSVALHQALGDGADGLINLLAGRVTDQGLRLTRALEAAADRAWKALEVALAGESWWQQIKGALGAREDQAFARQVRAFLDGAPLAELGEQGQFRQQCLRELRQAQRSGALAGAVNLPELARQAAGLARADPQALLRAQWGALSSAAQELQRAGYPGLASLVGRRQSGTPLLVLVVRCS
jgi:hypothetical protein